MSAKVRIVFLVTFALFSDAFSPSARARVIPGTTPHGRLPSALLLPTHRRGSRQTVLRADSLLNDDRRGRNQKEKEAAWLRRMWLRIIRRQSSRESTPLHMQSIDEETEALLESISYTYRQNQDYILKNFEDLSPDIILPEISPSEIDSEFFDVSIAAATSPKQTISVSRLMGMYFENILTGIIERNAIEEPEDLQIQAFPRGNVMSLLRGRFSTDARVDVGRLCFPLIRLSGGSLEIKRMTLNVKGFLPSQQGSSSRFPEQFDLHAHDLTFSRHDLLFSRTIKNNLRRLLVRILRDRGVQTSTIEVSSLDILVSDQRHNGVLFVIRMQSSDIFTPPTGCWLHSHPERYLAKEKQKLLLVHLYRLKSGLVFPLPAVGMFLHSRAWKFLSTATLDCSSQSSRTLTWT